MQALASAAAVPLLRGRVRGRTERLRLDRHVALVDERPEGSHQALRPGTRRCRARPGRRRHPRGPLRRVLTLTRGGPNRLSCTGGALAVLAASATVSSSPGSPLAVSQQTLVRKMLLTRASFMRVSTQNRCRGGECVLSTPAWKGCSPQGGCSRLEPLPDVEQIPRPVEEQQHTRRRVLQWFFIT